MLLLELLAIVVTCIGALFGIWTTDDVNVRNASIASGIIAVGVMTSGTIAVRKTRSAKRAAEDAERKRQDIAEETKRRDERAEQQIAELQNELRRRDAKADQQMAGLHEQVLDNTYAAFAGRALSELEVVWEFKNVPADVLTVITLGEMMIDTQFLRDDEYRGIDADTRRALYNSWGIDYCMDPMLGAIVRGQADLDEMYEAEDLAAAIDEYENERDEWIQNVGAHIAYKGSYYELLFPLNTQLNAAIALGKKADDQVSADLPEHEYIPGTAADTNQQFEVSTRASETGFTITWRYEQASLKRSVEAKSELMAGLPKAFSFIIIQDGIERSRYLADVAPQFPLDASMVWRHDPKTWDSESTLQIFVNGNKHKPYTYEVIKTSTFEQTKDMGGYDAPETLYTCTKFDCLRRDSRFEEPKNDR